MSRSDSERAVKPNLLVIGAMKASTTLFCQALGRHPKVWFPREKEPRYFSSDSYGTPGAWESYLELFRDCPPDRLVIGEGSTDYTKIPRCGPTPRRIREALGRPKLIYILRDPVDRTVSNYKHAYLMGAWWRGITLDEAIDVDPILITPSCYMQQIRAFHEEFGEDSIHIILAEELHADPCGVLEEASRYLGIDFHEGWRTPLPVVNSEADLRALGAVTRLLGVKWAGRLSELLPAAVKRMAKRLIGAAVPNTRVPPKVTAEARRRVLELVAADLQELRGLLGDRLDRWPSVQALERGSPSPAERVGAHSASGCQPGPPSGPGNGAAGREP
jgi:Sulfotransferase family